MSETRIALSSLGPEGDVFTVDDPAVWAGPIRECDLPWRVSRPLSAEVELVPGDGGCLARGRLRGEIVVPCDRCAEDAVVPIDQTFDSFEPWPGEEDGRDEKKLPDFDPDTDELVLRRGPDGGLIFDLAALLWEEFVLAVPFKPLCRPECRGLCPLCGQNLNEGSCACAPDTSDPRLAALRGLHLSQPSARQSREK